MPFIERGGCLAVFFFCTGACLLLAGRASRAQTNPPAESAEKLVAASATGSRQYSSEQVIEVSGLRVGQPVRREDLQTAADRLAHSGLFSKVLYSFSTDASGMELQFEVQDAPSFSVSFDNFPWFTNHELSQAIRQAGIPFSGTAPADGAILDRMAQALEKALASRGIHASVDHRLIEPPTSDQQEEQFRVVGASLNVSAVEFSDALASSDPHIKDQLSLLVGKPFSRFEVERFDFEHVRPLYLAHAYLHVRFGQPSTRFSGNPLGPPPKSVVVVVPIEPGSVYSWGGVTWQGNRALSSAALDALEQAAGLSPGAPADGMKIFALWESVRSAYGHLGYLNAQVTPAEAFNEVSPRAMYHVSIREGPQYRMGDLVLTGLAVESEKRVREAWRIPKGQVFDLTYYNQFLSEGIRKALAGLPAEGDTVGRWLRKNPKASTVDVLLDFR